MSKLMVKVDDIWVPMEGLKGDTGPLPADESIPDTALVTDGAKTNTAYLMGNRLTKDAEGELISVEDAYAVPPMSFSVDGVSTQVMTTGKNLCPHKRSQWGSIRFSSVGSGTVVTSGGVTHYYIAVPLEEGQSVTWHRNSLAQSPGFFRYCSDYPPVIGSTLSGGITLTNHTVYTMTNDDGTKPCVILCATSNGMPSDADLEKMQAQLEYGASFTSYEPYSGGAASPRPDWPQEIVSVDDPKLTFVGKNLLNLNSTPASSSSRGIDFSWNELYFKATGTLTQNNADSLAMYLSEPTLLKSGITYVFSFDGTMTGVGANIFYFHTMRPGTTIDSLRYVFGGRDVVKWTYKPTEDMLLTSISFRIGTSYSNVNINGRWQLELGSSASEYKPYSGDIAQLQDVILRSLPDGTKDELYLTYIRPSTREGWAWYEPTLTQRVRVMTLDGSETWGKDRFGFYHRMDELATADGDYSKSLLCNCLMPYSLYTLLSGKSGISGYRKIATSGFNWLYVNVEGINTIANLRPWLAEHTPTVLYQTFEPPTTETLNPIELPIMQAGTTNIWTDPSTNLSVTYERDRNIVITNLKAAVADLATS